MATFACVGLEIPRSFTTLTAKLLGAWALVVFGVGFWFRLGAALLLLLLLLPPPLLLLPEETLLATAALPERWLLAALVLLAMLIAPPLPGREPLPTESGLTPLALLDCLFDCCCWYCCCCCCWLYAANCGACAWVGVNPGAVIALMGDICEAVGEVSTSDGGREEALSWS